jgi:hypothetical protein
MSNKILNLLATYLLWVIATAIAWLAGIFDLTKASAHSYLEIARLIPVYLLAGLLIGVVAGIGQALILRKLMPKISRWFWATTLGYALAFPISLILTVLIPAIAFPLQGEKFLPFAGTSTMTIYLMNSLFWGAFIIGIAQWQVLKQIVQKPNAKKAALWIFSSWLGCGLGIFVRGWLWNVHLAGLDRVVIGIVIGMITGLALLILLKQSDSA